MKTILVSACTEGNGHLTQALALKEHLNKEEYEIVSAVVPNKKKGIPLEVHTKGSYTCLPVPQFLER